MTEGAKFKFESVTNPKGVKPFDLEALTVDLHRITCRKKKTWTHVPKFARFHTVFETPCPSRNSFHI